MFKRALVFAALALAACGDDDVSSVKSACKDACTQLLSCSDRSDADTCPDVCTATGPALAASNCDSAGTAAYRCIADKKLCDLDDDGGPCASLFTEYSACVGPLCVSDAANPICFDQSYSECFDDCSAAATCNGDDTDACDAICGRDNLTAAAADCRAEVDALYACRASASDRCAIGNACANEQAARDACMAPYCSDHGDDQSTLCADR